MWNNFSHYSINLPNLASASTRCFSLHISVPGDICWPLLRLDPLDVGLTKLVPLLLLDGPPVTFDDGTLIADAVPFDFVANSFNFSEYSDSKVTAPLLVPVKGRPVPDGVAEAPEEKRLGKTPPNCLVTANIWFSLKSFDFEEDCPVDVQEVMSNNKWKKTSHSSNTVLRN